MNSPLLVVAALAVVAPGVWAQGPAASQVVLRLDHAVIVVRDLKGAQRDLAPWGFRFKAGRLHPDHLLNRHIKFRDGTALELMTLVGPPTDPTATEYARLLASRPGGAYVAILCEDLDRVAHAADRAGLVPQRSTRGTWQFLSFAPSSDAAAIFFGSGWQLARDPDSLVTHENGATGLREAWLEGGPRLDSLLRALGVAAADSVRLPDGREGRRWGLGDGALVVARPSVATSRIRPFGVVIESSNRRSPPTAQVMPGFWIGFQH